MDAIQKWRRKDSLPRTRRTCGSTVSSASRPTKPKPALLCSAKWTRQSRGRERGWGGTGWAVSELAGPHLPAPPCDSDARPASGQMSFTSRIRTWLLGGILKVTRLSKLILISKSRVYQLAYWIGASPVTGIAHLAGSGDELVRHTWVTRSREHFSGRPASETLVSTAPGQLICGIAKERSDENALGFRGSSRSLFINSLSLKGI